MDFYPVMVEAFPPEYCGKAKGVVGRPTGAAAGKGLCNHKSQPTQWEPRNDARAT